MEIEDDLLERDIQLELAREGSDTADDVCYDNHGIAGGDMCDFENVSFPYQSMQELKQLHSQFKSDINSFISDDTAVTDLPYLEFSVSTSDCTPGPTADPISPETDGDSDNEDSFQIEKEQKESQQIFNSIIQATPSSLCHHTELDDTQEQDNTILVELEKIQDAKDYQNLLHAQLKFRLEKMGAKKKALQSSIRSCRDNLLSMYEQRDSITRDIQVWLTRDLEKEKEKYVDLDETVKVLTKTELGRVRILEVALEEHVVRGSEMREMIKKAKVEEEKIKELYMVETQLLDARKKEIVSLARENESLSEKLKDVQELVDRKQRKAAILIQSHWKRFVARRSFKTLLDSVIKIQYNVRRTRRIRAKTAIKIQSIWRGYQIRKVYADMKKNLIDDEDFDFDFAEDDLDDFLDEMDEFVYDTKKDITTISKSLSHTQHAELSLARHREDVNQVATEWGFTNNHTAELALKNKKRLQQMQNKNITRKQRADPLERLRHFRTHAQPKQEEVIARKKAQTTILWTKIQNKTS